MNRQIAFAYAIAGLAVAIALIAVIGSTTGLFDPANVEPANSPPVTAEAPIPGTMLDGPLAAPAFESNGDWTGAQLPPEVVYVDAPARAGRRYFDDDDDEADDEDDHERREHRRRSRHRDGHGHDDDD